MPYGMQRWLEILAVPSEENMEKRFGKSWPYYTVISFCQLSVLSVSLKMC